MVFSRSQKFLAVLLIIIIILSYPIGNANHLLNWGVFSILVSGFSEINILEISQALILLFTIVETFSFRKTIINKFNFVSFLLRVSMLIFLFYEEVLQEVSLQFHNDVQRAQEHLPRLPNSP